MTSERPCPVLVLHALHETAAADLDASADDPGDVLVNRLGAINDAILAHEALSPDGLRVQAAIIREVTAGFEYGEHCNAIIRLAAAYAERLATTQETAR